MSRTGRQLLSGTVVLLVLSGCAQQLGQLGRLRTNLSRATAETLSPGATYEQLNQWGKWVLLHGDWYDLTGSMDHGAVRVNPNGRIASLRATYDGEQIRIGGDFIVSFPNRHDGRHILVIKLITQNPGENQVVADRSITVFNGRGD